MKTEKIITSRSRGELIAELNAESHGKWLFFWGHTPSKNGSVSKSCFSQWWEGHAFVQDDLCYATAEHFMMAEKARLFGDLESMDGILKAKSPALAKKMGRTVKGFDERVWLEARWKIVVQGNLLKFGQHSDLNDFLLKTGERILVEASPADAIWGIGLGADHPDVENPRKWRGLNLLGFALMQVRHQLRMEVSV